MDLEADDAPSALQSRLGLHEGSLPAQVWSSAALMARLKEPGKSPRGSLDGIGSIFSDAIVAAHRQESPSRQLGLAWKLS